MHYIMPVIPFSHKTTITIFNPRDATGADLNELISDDDRARYPKSDPRRADFVAGRVALRKTSPVSLKSKIIYDSLGKPLLEDNRSLEISISHSNRWGAASVSDARFVAVDIEKIRTRDNTLIDYILSEKELSLIDMPITDKILTVLWTMKESIMKSLGVGLIAPHLIVLASFLSYDGAYRADFAYRNSNKGSDIGLWSVKTILVEDFAISVAYPKKLHESIILVWNIKNGLQPAEQMSVT